MIKHQVENTIDRYNAHIYTERSFEPHFHKNYELIYSFYGNVTIFVNNLSIELTKGELLLISPYATHSFSVDSSSRIWVGVFSPEYILHFSSRQKFMQYSKFCCEKNIENFLIDYLFNKNIPALYIAKSCLYMICNECEKNASIIEKRGKLDFKSRVIDYLSKNLAESITLSDAAKALNYEYHYFSKLFSQHFNLPYTQFVHILRNEYACELLLDETKSIAFISGACGFNSIRNFNRIFKASNGKTPSEYRKNNTIHLSQ